MLKHPWIEYPLIFLALAGPLVVVILRLTIRKTITHKDGAIEVRPLGIGARVLQLIGILTIVPLITVLSLEAALSGEATGTLLGAIVGYALGGITAPVPKE